MKVLSVLLLIVLFFSVFLYLSRTYGNSTIHTDKEYIDGRLSYRVVHIQSTWVDAIIMSTLMTGMFMIPIGIFILNWRKTNGI